MRRRIVALILGLTVVFGLSACGHNNFRDVTGVKSQTPYIEVWSNVDRAPNIFLVCIHGVGFATTTRNYGDAIQRVPEWDTYCAAHS